MQSYLYHINLIDLAALGSLLIGIAFALLLGFAEKPDKKANLFLSLALVAAVLKTDGLTPLFFPALGPLLYFYVRQLTCPDRRFRWKDRLHFCPLLVGFWIPAWLALISVIIYSLLSHRLIQDFYRRIRPVLTDRPRFAFRQLDRVLLLLGLSCVLSLFNTIFLFTIAFVLIGMAADAILKPDNDVQQAMPITGRSDAREKGRRLKEAVAAGRFYEDADLTLTTLAIKLSIHPHDLSRIINLGLQKNFNDFINEFRVREVARKMHDPAYDRFTLMGIAYESGFNSERTFHRVFKEMTGKTPLEYKNSRRKELPIDKLAPLSRIRPVILRSEDPYWVSHKSKRKYMFRNYLKIAWRNLVRNEASSFINIAGLTVGMAAAIIIALWIWDELSFNTYHSNYNRIAQVMQQQTFNNVVATTHSVPYPLNAEFKKSYGGDFKHVVFLSWMQKHILNVGNKNVSFPGSFIAPDGPKMFSLRMLKGSYHALNDPSSIIISESAAKALFGDSEPMNKLVRLDSKASFKVTGVYADLPVNTTLHGIAFLAPWDYYYATAWANNPTKTWTDDSFQLFVQVSDHADMGKVSAKIRDTKFNNISKEAARTKPVIFLQPKSKWHLYAEFKNGVNIGGAIQYVWLLGVIGAFVLLLACINFMNLSTARSEKRAREVGIRKAVGSLRGQLILQFFSESLLIATLAFVFSILLVWLTLPWFNDLTGKEISILWGTPLFWLAALGFTFFTGIVAGLYPALYLSSFKPVKVLKGTFKAGKFASIPRKVLVVTQFSVSVMLIIGTIIVFKQIQFAKDRPVGYSRDGLVYIETTTDALHPQFRPMRDELLKSGAVTEAAESSSPATDVWNNRGDITWPGKDPSITVNFGNLRVTTGYGKTVGWQFVAGRDFSDQFLSDSLAVVLNESAVKYMGLKKPVGETIKLGTWGLTVIGIVKDMVMQSPYEPVKPTIFYLSRNGFSFLNFRLNPHLGAQTAIDKIGAIFKIYGPDIPFSYRFADDEYAKKFASEVRIGKLAWCFAALAIFISCLGLFGMASFVAEQRRKEIGVRKVLGASVFSLWQAMSMDFLRLVAISLLIASPLAYYFVHGWLEHFTYRAAFSWWVFAMTAAGTIVITLLTVSYETIKAALVNPVKSLRSE